jgi:hypothetical protein
MRPKLCAMNSIGFDLRQASPHSQGLKTILAAHLKDLTPPWLHNPASSTTAANNFAGPALAES